MHATRGEAGKGLGLTLSTLVTGTPQLSSFSLVPYWKVSSKEGLSLAFSNDVVVVRIAAALPYPVPRPNSMSMSLMASHTGALSGTTALLVTGALLATPPQAERTAPLEKSPLLEAHTASRFTELLELDTDS